MYICSNAFVISFSEGEGSVVGEPSSQITILLSILTRVLREKEKQVEEFQHKLSEQTMSEVYILFLSCTRMVYILFLSCTRLYEHTSIVERSKQLQPTHKSFCVHDM